MLARWLGCPQALRIPYTRLRRRTVAAGGPRARQSSTGVGTDRSLALSAIAQPACCGERRDATQSWERELTRYAQRLQLEAARGPKRRAGLYAEDSTAVRRQGRALLQSIRKVGDAAAAFVAECLQRGERARGTNTLVRVLAVDCMHDPWFLLSAATIKRLLGAQTSADGLAQTNALLLAAVPSTKRLPEHIVHAVVWAMFRHRNYREASLWAQHLSDSNIGGAVAGLVLRSLREHLRTVTPPPALRTRGISVHSFFALVGDCEINCQAQRVLRLLRRHCPGSVTEGHLAKALEIELASLPPEWRLPQAPDLLLHQFRRCHIEPGAQTLLMLASAYRARGDSQFAQWMLAQGAPGAPHPDPDSSTAGADTIGRALDKMRTAGQRPPAPLVTSAVAWMVDAGRIAAAERLWRDYGCQCTAPSGERPNVLALAKLIQGYARTGSVEKATAFFHDACAHEAAVASAGRSSHLTGLLNVVLRSSIRGIAASGPVPARHDLVLLQIAARFQVPFDTATYNVLFAGLSQEAHVRVSSAHAAPPRLDNIAQAMHGLYGHMAERDVAPDDVSVAHLLPMWVVLGRMDLARVLWRRCAGGRPPGTTAQLRGHVLAQARRWGVADRIQLLVGAP